MNSISLTETIAQKERELDALKRELVLERDLTRLPRGQFTVLRCGLGRSAIALLASEVDEVVRMVALTHLPEAPPWVLGLLTLGERRLVIVDLAARESGTRRTPDPSEFIVVTTTHRGSCGLVVERVDELCSVESSLVHRPSLDVPFGAHVLGVTTIGEQPVVLLSTAPLCLDELTLEVDK